MHSLFIKTLFVSGKRFYVFELALIIEKYYKGAIISVADCTKKFVYLLDTHFSAWKKGSSKHFNQTMTKNMLHTKNRHKTWEASILPIPTNSGQLRFNEDTNGLVRQYIPNRLLDFNRQKCG